MLVKKPLTKDVSAYRKALLDKIKSLVYDESRNKEDLQVEADLEEILFRYASVVK